MFLSRIRIAPSGPQDASLLRELTHPYRLHQWLWSHFPSDCDERPFLYRLDRHAHGLEIYVLSTLDPAMEGKVPGAQTKVFEPVFRRNQVLAFSLRVSPVVSRNDHGPGRGKRHDVVMHAKRQAREEGATPSEAQVVQEAGCNWLLQRAERLGIRVPSDACVAEAYTQHRFRRAPGQKEIQFSTIDLEGRCVVESPERLMKAISTGIGPQKGFGNGLLLVRPG